MAQTRTRALAKTENQKTSLFVVAGAVVVIAADETDLVAFTARIIERHMRNCD
jgi:hypothetical protein